MLTEIKVKVLSVKQFNKKFRVGSPVRHKGVQDDTEFLTVVQKKAFHFEGKNYFVNSRGHCIELSEVIE